MQEIVEIVDWMQLGLRLGLSLPRLKEIEANYHKVEERRMDMIHSWLINTAEPTWEKLISAIDKLGHVHIAFKMKAKFHVESSREIASDGK